MLTKGYFCIDNMRCILYLIIILYLIFVSAFSPLLGFIFCTSVLAFGYWINIYTRLPLVLLIIFNYSFVGASKKFALGEKADDFGNLYYPLFQYIEGGGSVFYQSFSGGVEFFLPLYFKILNLIFGDLNGSTILACVSFLVLSLFYIWLEIFGMENIPPKYKSLGIAIALFFLSFMIYLQYMRQIFGSIFILYALSFWFKNKRVLSLSFFAVSIISHITSILLFPLFLILMSDNKSFKNIIIFLVLIFSYLFYYLIGYIFDANLLGVATYKLSFYQNHDIRINNIFIAKFLILSVLFSILFKSKEHIRYKSLALYSLFILTFTLNLGEFPMRMLNLVLGVLVGYLLFIHIYRFNLLLRVFFVLYVLASGYRYIYFMDYISYMEAGSYTGLWYSYNWFGDKPFYYLK